MKKIVLAVVITLSVFVLSACTLGSASSPKDKVKEFLDKYKNQDSEVLNDLDETISSEYTGEYKERYKTLMVNQYKNMEYRIIDEVIDGNTALVNTEITVYDYSNALDNADKYLTEHESEFYKNSSDETTRDNENTTENNNVKTDTKEIDNDKFLDYKLDLLESVSDKKTYTIEFSLTKENDTWKLDSLTDSDIEKIHGIYSE